MNKKFSGALIPILLCTLALEADETYEKNRTANRLYSQGKYKQAVELYDEALLESPDEQAIRINKGSALHKMGTYEQARESYEAAQGIEDKGIRADLHYNLGNTLFRQGEQMQTGGNPSAMEKFKEAYQHYIKALEIRPEDMDAKWNLQLAYQRIKQMEKQQQDQKQNKQDQNKQDQDEQNQNNRQNSQDQKEQDKKQQQQNNDQQTSGEKDQAQQEQKRKEEGESKDEKQKMPQPRKQKSDMEKKEAKRLLQQYADDADELNKPKKRVGVMQAGEPEKDW